MSTEKEEFLLKVTNSHTYEVVKQLEGDLSYAVPGDRYQSDVLYNRGYNINQLVTDGYMKCVDEPFEWQKELVGKNVRSVYVYCPECKTFGINTPLNIKCGNCDYPKGITYYDAHTINQLINNQ